MTDAPFVRIAELEIDPAQLSQFKVAVTTSIETSIRVEPNVLALYAVADSKIPTRITVFEIYADRASYEAHRQTEHFKNFFESTKAMVVSRRLIDTLPIVLCAKPQV